MKIFAFYVFLQLIEMNETVKFALTELFYSI